MGMGDGAELLAAWAGTRPAAATFTSNATPMLAAHLTMRFIDPHSMSVQNDRDRPLARLDDLLPGRFEQRVPIGCEFSEVLGRTRCTDPSKVAHQM
jgi:hypothetical protein